MPDAFEITVRVKPGSRKGPLVDETTGDPAAAFTVFVRERAVDNAANGGVVRAISEHFSVPRSHVTIVRGTTSRIKRVRVLRMD